MKSQTRRNVCHNFSLTTDDEWISWNRAKLTSISKLRGRNVNRRWLITSKFNVLLSRQLTKKRSTVWAKSVILVAEKLKCVLMMNNSKFNHNLMHLAVGTWLIVMAQVGISHSPVVYWVSTVRYMNYALCRVEHHSYMLHAENLFFYYANYIILTNGVFHNKELYRCFARSGTHSSIDYSHSCIQFIKIIFTSYVRIFKEKRKHPSSFLPANLKR